MARADDDRPVLLGFDGSDQARDAAALGSLLAGTLGAPLVAVAVAAHEAPHGLDAALEGALRDVAAERLRELPDGAHPRTELLPVTSGSPARGLHDEAVRLGARAIVLGSTHRAGIGRVFPGSTASRLLQGAPCAVAIAPRGYAASAPPDIRVVEIAFDGSPEAWGAVAEGGELAQAAGATVRLVAASGPPTSGADAAAQAPAASSPTGAARMGWLDEEVRRAADSLPEGLRPAWRVEHGEPVRIILAEAEKGVDLIAMGSRGYGPVAVALLGSVSREILRDAPCPVLLARRSAGR